MPCSYRIIYIVIPLTQALCTCAVQMTTSDFGVLFQATAEI